MLIKKQLFQAIYLGTLGVFVMGCTESSTPVSNTESTNRTTVNRPVLPDPVATQPKLEPNNTGVNVRDRENTAKTPFNQHENSADIEITADIRKQIGETKMSTNAQNVKIITQHGKVTLRGPVETEQEKSRVAEIAQSIAGATQVENLLEIKSE